MIFKKCNDPSCCSPYRSPILKRLPTGFLPAPRVYTHNTEGELELCKPNDVDKTVEYASLSDILAQPVDQELPFDAYNKKVEVNSLLCPFCRLSLCTPAEVQRHRRAMHFGRRAPRHEAFELQEINEDDSIKEIIDEVEGRFLCIMEDEEDMEWKSLPPTHPLIVVYKKERERLLQGVTDGPVEIPESELPEFLSSIFEDK